MLSQFFIANKSGVCITSEGLDRIWPKDDSEPLTLDGKMPFHLPPTCIDGAKPFEEEVGRDKLISFIFNGKELPDHVPAIPLPDPMGFMIGIIVIWILVKLFKNCDDFENIR